MDIGSQQRVIIVEPVEFPEAAPEPAPEPAAPPQPATEPVGEWPLPYELEPEPVR